MFDGNSLSSSLLDTLVDDAKTTSCENVSM